MLFVRPPAGPVALRKESVDRNKQIIDLKAIDKQSLSARRAWIEIPIASPRTNCFKVALRKESVDRNRHKKAPARL